MHDVLLAVGVWIPEGDILGIPELLRSCQTPYTVIERQCVLGGMLQFVKEQQSGHMAAMLSQLGTESGTSWQEACC